jgi:hypothetical protein
VSISRRKFVKAGIVATLCAPLVSLKSALAGTALTSQPSTDSSNVSLEQLGYYNEATFAPYVNTRFRVYLGPSNIRSLKLTEVTDYLPSLSQQAGEAASTGSECFSLLFTIPAGKPFTQDTYLIEHPALGTFYMFVVPIGAHSRTSSDYYEAVIYRRQQFAGGQETINVTGAKPATPTAQPAQNQQPVTLGAPLIILPGKQDVDTRDERDIYRFRPPKEEQPTAAEKAKAERAKKKEIYPLTLAQSPAINGLRLGMTQEQVLALFPGSKSDKDVRLELDRPPSRFGVSGFTVRPERYSTHSKFEGISQIVFTLFDGRVSTLYVGYDGPLWGHVDEFVSEFSGRLHLPAADGWEAYVGMDDQLKTLKCKELEISLFAGGKNLAINYAQMRDLVALQKYKERRRARMKDEGGRMK